jgi:long-subunit fatty acid transport protein
MKKPMKVTLIFATFIAASAILVNAQAANEKKAAPAAAASAPAADAKAEPKAPAALATKKTTDVSFEDVLVQGKYHFSDEAVTTVEQDKILDALLGVRTDFKDRLKNSAARH